MRTLPARSNVQAGLIRASSLIKHTLSRLSRRRAEVSAPSVSCDMKALLIGVCTWVVHFLPCVTTGGTVVCALTASGQVMAQLIAVS